MISALSATVALAAGSRSVADPWRWDAPLAPAVASAAEGQRLLLLVVDGDEASRRLRRLAWGRPPLAPALAGLITLAYEGGAGEGRHVARRFNVVTFPSLILVDREANELGRISSYDGVESLVADLFDLQSGDGALSRLVSLWHETPNDLALTLRVAHEYALRGLAAPAKSFRERVELLDQKNLRGAAARARWVECELLLRRSLEDAGAAGRCLRQLARDYPRSREAALSAGRTP